MAELIDKEIDGNVMLHGGHNESERQEGIEEFKGDKNIMVCTDIFDMGVNFQFADYIIHMDIPWTQAQFDQRTDRIHRLGAESTKVVIDIVARESFEVKIKEKMERKGEISDQIIEDQKEGFEDDEFLERMMKNET